MNDVDMLEEEDENKENRRPPAPVPPAASSMFSYSSISAKIFKFLPKPFERKRSRAEDSEDQPSSGSDKKRKKISMSFSARDNNSLQYVPSAGVGCKDEDKSLQYRIYMSKRDPLDI